MTVLWRKSSHPCDRSFRSQNEPCFGRIFQKGDVICMTLKKTTKVKVPSEEGSCWLFFGNVSYKCLAMFLQSFLQRTTNGRSRLVDSTDSTTNRLRQLFFQHKGWATFIFVNDATLIINQSS